MYQILLFPITSKAFPPRFWLFKFLAMPSSFLRLKRSDDNIERKQGPYRLGQLMAATRIFIDPRIPI